MPWKVSSKLQILFLSSIGVYRTINEFYSQNLDDIWQLKLTDNLSAYQSIINSVISGVILVREFTGHLYIASYFLILYPILMGKMRSVLLVWMLVSGMRSILLNLGVAIIGIIVCASREEFNYECFRFVTEEAVDLGCSIYMWTVVNDYYHTLKKVSVRSHFQSPFTSPNTSSIAEDTSSSLLSSDEWSLPLSLVEEFQKSTKENLLESATKTTTDSSKNLRERSVDSLLAQAMVDWFIKKLVKIKPKEGNDNGISKNLSGIDSKNVNSFRQRIKKSIADIDESDIKDLLASQNSIQKTTELRDVSEFDNQSNETKIQCFSYKDSENSVLQGSPQEVKKDLNKVRDLISEIQRSMSNINDCIASKQTTSITPFENIMIGEEKNLDETMPLEPLNAVTLVKHLFNDSFESVVERMKCGHLENDVAAVTDKSNHCETVINEFDGEANKDNLSEEYRTALDSNGKALDCSIVVVKPLLEGVIDNASHNKQSILKKENLEQEISKNLNESQKDNDLINSNILKVPLIDTNLEINSKLKTGIRKKISFQDKEFLCTSDKLNSKIPTFNLGSQFVSRNTFDDFPESVRNVLKHVSRDRVSRKTDKLWKSNKPYTLNPNKENEFDTMLNYKRKDKASETECYIKALRHHFRRSNLTKAPIKRSKDTVLSQKSLKSIIENIKLSDGKKLKSSDLAGSSGVQYTHNSFLKKSAHANCSPLLVLKDTSSQTVTTMQLLMKIKEAEEEKLTP